MRNAVPWFAEWWDEVMRRVPCGNGFNQLSGSTLADWAVVFGSIGMTREEANAAIPWLAVKAPYAAKIAEETLELVQKARKERMLAPRDQEADASCGLCQGAGTVSVPPHFAVAFCECPKGAWMAASQVPPGRTIADQPGLKDLILRDRREAQERGAALLRKLGIDPDGPTKRTARQFWRRVVDCFGGAGPQRPAGASFGPPPERSARGRPNRS